MPTTQSTACLSDEALAMANRLRHRERPLRLLYFPGPGNVLGSFQHWQEGRDDPSTPSIAYSQQLYEAVAACGGEAEVWHQHDDATLQSGSFTFRPQPPFNFYAQGWRFHAEEWRHLRFVMEKVRSFQPDIIFHQQMLNHLWALRFVASSQRALIISLHNTLWPVGHPPSGLSRLLTQQNGNMLSRRTHAVLAVSDEIAQQVREVSLPAPPDLRIHIPQYADRSTSLEGKERSSGLHLLFLGRIDESKGVFDLLEAARRLREQGRERIRLTIAGDGRDLPALRQAITEQGVADWVTTPGQLSGQAVMDAVKSSDLLICPTTPRFAEGLAKTPLEAALVGVPSIISDVVPCGELLGDAAKVVKAGDVDDLQAAISEIDDNPALYQAMSEATAAVRKKVLDRRNSFASHIVLAMGEALRA